MTSEEMLFEEFGKRMIVPADEIRLSYFPEFGWDVFRRKITSGILNLPILRFNDSQKSTMFVDIRDFAVWYDTRRTRAQSDQKRKGHS